MLLFGNIIDFFYMDKRKNKAAKLKVLILEQALKMIGNKSFEDLHVETLCKQVKISKVTFFNYFPQKEDILLYHFRIWCLAREVELSKNRHEGMKGIFFLFDKLCDAMELYQGMMLGLTAYLSNIKRTPRPFPVKKEEKILLFPQFPEVSNIEILSLEQIIEKFVLEAIFKKEITKSTSTRDITNLFSSLFYGVIVVCHTNQLKPIKPYVRNIVDFAIKGLV